MYNILISFIVLKLYHQRNGDDLTNGTVSLTIKYYKDIN